MSQSLNDNGYFTGHSEHGINLQPEKIADTIGRLINDIFGKVNFRKSFLESLRKASQKKMSQSLHIVKYKNVN